MTFRRTCSNKACKDKLCNERVTGRPRKRPLPCDRVYKDSKRCAICNAVFSGHNGRSQHVQKMHNIRYMDYLIKYEGLTIPKCPFCGKDRKPKNGTEFHDTCCDLKCKQKQQIKTNLEVYGCENPYQSEKVREKYMKSNIKKNGYANPFCDEETKTKIRKFKLENRVKVLTGIFSDEFLDIQADGWKVVGTCRKCGHVEVLSRPFAKQRKFRDGVPVCTQCNRVGFGGKSYKEKHVCKFIRSIYSGRIKENDRSVLKNKIEFDWEKPKELDIYLPDLKLAFEFNGDCYHGHGKLSSDRKRMIDAWKAEECKRLGITFVSIWEHDWDNNMDNVKENIKHLIEQCSNKFNSGDATPVSDSGI